MKKLLAAMFVALLMVGCGEEGKKKQGQEEAKEEAAVRDKIIAGAIDKKMLQRRGEYGERLSYAPNEQTPYTGWVKTMYGNGQIKYLVHLKDGKQDGLTTKWDENGRKKVERNFKDEKWDGLSVLWYENGQKRDEGHYKDGSADGLWTFWYENGQKKEESNFKNGTEDGLGGNWYENGQIGFVCKMAMGKYIKAKSWKPNGEKCPHTNLVDGNGVLVRYHENGRKIGESTYKDGKKDGLQMFWYENGQKGMEAVSANGKLVTYRAWKLNGEKCPVTNFKDGNGVTVFYNPEDGTEFRRITHKDGEPISD